MTSAWIALAVLLAGCGSGGSDAAKSEVECGASWVQDPPIAGTCDLACMEMTEGTGPGCTTQIMTGNGVVGCSATFEVDGDVGCCFDAGQPSRVVSPNEPKRDRRVFFLSCAD